MNILLLNYPYLQKEYLKLGHTTVSAGSYQDCDILLTDYTFQELANKIDPAEFELVIFADGLDSHPLFTGLQHFACPTVYIGIDSTINFFWQKYFADCFDLVFFDQPAEYQQLRKIHPHVHPLLLGFDSDIYRDYGEEKIYDITFVGRFNCANRIKRQNLINLIRKHNFKIHIVDGKQSRLTPLEVARVYNKSRIVLNETLFPSLNLRLFEIIGSGALAFTEATCAYTSYYFQPEKDLILYTPENIITKLAYYLKNGDKREEISRRSLKKGHRYHRDLNRAETVLARGREMKGKRKGSPASTAAAAMQINLKWPATPLRQKNREIIESYLKQVQQNPDTSENEKLLYLKLLYHCGRMGSIKTEIEGMQIEDIKDAELLVFIFWFALESELTELSCRTYQQVCDGDKSNTLQKHLASPKNLTAILPEIYFNCGKFLFEKGIRINHGFTSTAMSPLYYTAFDFFTVCSDSQNSRLEISLNYMIQILIESKAYDFAALLYGRLCQFYPANLEYQQLKKIYEKKSYKM